MSKNAGKKRNVSKDALHTIVDYTLASNVKRFVMINLTWKSVFLQWVTEDYI